jgi:hypothetical protein
MAGAAMARFNQMKRLNSAYELSQSQVATPYDAVALFWSLTHQCRERLETVLDLGAGDGRFASGGSFGKYVGIEIDPSRSKSAQLPENARIISGCAFEHPDSGYDACIGNPPYVRHHDIESPWKDEVIDRINRELGVRLNKRCNLYLYFICLGLLKTRDDGILSFIVPFEWVSRPSAGPVRKLIQMRRWEVKVFRFQYPVFPGVLTTASITIVDKRNAASHWSYFDIGDDKHPKVRNGVVDHPSGVLTHSDRGWLWAMRGISPGSQKIFCLTEGERLHHGLSRRDVVPCVTSLRQVPRHLSQLTFRAFERHFVRAGARCWLIKSHKGTCSKAIKAYLNSIPPAEHDNYTCNSREPWYRYAMHPIPRLLVSSGFTDTGPKVLINSVGAQAIGAVTGVHSNRAVACRCVQQHLRNVEFDDLIVPHAKSLKKVEVRQLNTVLNAYTKKSHGEKRS